MTPWAGIVEEIRQEKRAGASPCRSPAEDAAPGVRLYHLPGHRRAARPTHLRRSSGSVERL
jgi:hypothetical protein